MRINKSLITLASGGSASTVPWSGVTGTPTTLSGYGITDAVPSSRTLTINGVSYDLSANRTWTVGSVTSVALATGTTGTDVNVSGSPITGSGTITLNIPDASAFNRGLITTSTQTIAGVKTFSGNRTNINGLLDLGNYIQMQELTLSSGSPSSGKGYIWLNSATSTLYFRNDLNVDYDLTSSSNSVPTTRTLTINDVAYDLSANRSWDIGDYGTW